jgi:ABC transporter fused permease/ATP-binding protein
MPPDIPGERPARSLGVLWRLVALVAPHRMRFILAVITLVAASGLSLVYPRAARYAIDVGMGADSTRMLDQIVLGLLAIFFLHAALVWLRHYSMSWLGERVVADLRGIVVDRVLSLPMSWFHERQTGELVGRLASDVTVIEGVVGTEISMALRNAIQLVGGLVFLILIHARLTLMMLAVVPPIVVATVWFGRSLRKKSRAVQDQLAKVSGQIQESLGAIMTVQSFVREGHEASRYKHGVEAAFHETLRLVRWRASFIATAMTAGYAAIAVIIWLGGRAMIAGELTAGQLTEFFLYTFIVAGALGELASLWGALQRAAGATERLYDIIDTTPSIRDPEGATPLPAGGGAITFDDVSFAYPSRPDAAVLHDLRLTVAPGEVVALVGPSGSGKSTLLQLLFRFHDVTGGKITFEGVDLRQLRLGELRRALAMVAQEPVLFSGTIRDNIGYGKRDASAAEIERAAVDANAHEFVSGFPDGYDTLVGERGVKLSGGQKQRIAIARALVANPRVLILDEATSNLDAESEAQVQQALARLMKGRTTLIVAHRLSTVRDADRIAVLEQGHIVEIGTHEQLMANVDPYRATPGPYRRLIERQVIVG